ncbi:hypothetical protein ACVNS2_06365 [Paenibacillus caseinilyticus]|uniref:Uncharacterized protein n=1 Tax=Paenibacillus mucilaginosus K02 TaxID=997761 RepID=I0BD52_9BACL|nr:hypothetical protein [Paenibacillus mucilaginosus]AFH60299.2 hypothetical protein B2K_06100 [Paenibacillus mucilaginosus K02]
MSGGAGDRLLKLAAAYAPVMLLDEQEPFVPVRCGVTLFEASGPSPSFRRELRFDPAEVSSVIEYAVYWDYDIGHLYDLEHVWVYLGHQGEVVRCEASFHGKFFLGLLPDRSNLEDGRRPVLYVQAGKHAFSAMPELFRLLPDGERAGMELAGEGGVLVPDLFRGTFATDAELDELASRHLQAFRFRPSHRYRRYEWPADAFAPWSALREEIPRRMNALLARLRAEAK